MNQETIKRAEFLVREKKRLVLLISALEELQAKQDANPDTYVGLSIQGITFSNKEDRVGGRLYKLIINECRKSLEKVEEEFSSL